MRLIDADALKEDIEQQCALLRLMKDNDELIQISLVLESGFMAQIDKMPTIEDRKTGKWIRGDAEKLTGSQRCSICHKACYKGNDYFNYCPNCGARMKKPMTIPEEIINSVLGYDD